MTMTIIKLAHLYAGDRDGVMQYAPAQESTLFADIMFHLTHSSRHLGSIEALRGL